MQGVQVVGRGLTKPLCRCLRTILGNSRASDFTLQDTLQAAPRETEPSPAAPCLQQTGNCHQLRSVVND